MVAAKTTVLGDKGESGCRWKWVAGVTAKAGYLWVSQVKIGRMKLDSDEMSSISVVRSGSAGAVIIVDCGRDLGRIWRDQGALTERGFLAMVRFREVL